MILHLSSCRQATPSRDCRVPCIDLADGKAAASGREMPVCRRTGGRKRTDNQTGAVPTGAGTTREATMPARSALRITPSNAPGRSCACMADPQLARDPDHHRREQADERGGLLPESFVAVTTGIGECERMMHDRGSGVIELCLVTGAVTEKCVGKRRGGDIVRSAEP